VKLIVFSHKPCWRSGASPTGFATDGGFPFQMKALSELFDATILMVPCRAANPSFTETPLTGHNLSVVALSYPGGHGLSRKLMFPIWLAQNLPKILKGLCQSNAVHAPIPGDVGTVGMIGAFLLRKPLFVRHCGNWLKPRTMAEHFWHWFMEWSAGKTNVMLATGGAAQNPSTRNANIHWIFSSSLKQADLQTVARVRRLEPSRTLRVVHVSRQDLAKGAGQVIQAACLLRDRFPQIEVHIAGDGPALDGFKSLAAALGAEQQVHFHGKLNHQDVMGLLQKADVFCFPTTASDGFPKVVLEALASGLPVIATRVSAIPQLLGSGCGILLDDDSSLAVAKGIEDVLRDSCNYEAMSRQAINVARGYSIEAWRETIGAALTSAWGPLRGQVR
jgi:glycosyltransferase involved in cell wall biosynthesis